ncbi:MAG TPA: AbrB/MazE/SpoVT family DNA-binding domain-containing protein [Candidatus Nanoarchaeia archaeon]|nr:AbrB/MazE/SpoVT family DNA-binding domain-containing protein [Candidatus Nanoarchaeia archaeon]
MLSLTKMTSKGQVVIPQEIREREKLKEGEKLLVFGLDGAVILKKISGLEKAKSRDDFESLLESMWETAEKRKIRRADAEQEITDYRKNKNARSS